MQSLKIHGDMLLTLEVLRDFRNGLIGAVQGIDHLSLSETVVTVAEEGQTGTNQGPGKHILAVTSVDTSA